MIDLVDHHRAVAMTLLGDTAEVRDDRVIFMKEVATGQYPSSVGWRWLADDHRRLPNEEGVTCHMRKVSMCGK